MSMATGIETRLTSSLDIALGKTGIHCPIITPNRIQRATHRVRYFSKIPKERSFSFINDSLPFSICDYPNDKFNENIY